MIWYAAIINAPRPQRLVALSDVGQTPTPFASRASSPRHHRLSSATRARACSTIWSLSGLDKVETPVSEPSQVLTGLPLGLLQPPQHSLRLSSSSASRSHKWGQALELRHDEQRRCRAGLLQALLRVFSTLLGVTEHALHQARNDLWLLHDARTLRCQHAVDLLLRLGYSLFLPWSQSPQCRS